MFCPNLWKLLLQARSIIKSKMRSLYTLDILFVIVIVINYFLTIKVGEQLTEICTIDYFTT